MNRNILRFQCFFSKFGWTRELYNGESVCFEDENILAIRIYSDVPIDCYVMVAGELIKQKNNEIELENNHPITSIKVKTKQNEFEVVYRVWENDDGWTEFSQNGNPCGNDVIHGLQIALKGPIDSLYCVIDKCNKNLLSMNYLVSNLYINNYKSILLELLNDRSIQQDETIREVIGGYILPLKVLNYKIHGEIYLGGVCDESKSFVDGFVRNLYSKKTNFSCVEAYEFNELEAEYFDEEVVFGGVFLTHFGHFLVECLSRLWCFVSDNVTCFDTREIRIAVCTTGEIQCFMVELIKLLGIDMNRFIFIDRIVRFRKIYIPDQSFYTFSGYSNNYISIYDKMKEQIVPQKYEKIFLTRSKFDKGDSVNESFLDNVFKNNGFEIIAPEEYSVEEQIAFIAGAKTIACTEGTLSHLALFANAGTTLIILKRHENINLLAQSMINKIKGINVIYVDATFNLLPTHHVNGVFLYGPTKNFITFSKNMGYDITNEIENFRLVDYAYEYLEKWCDNYQDLKRFQWISQFDISDVLYCLSKALGKSPLDKKKYVTKFQEKYDKQEKKIKSLEKELKELKEECCLSKLNRFEHKGFLVTAHYTFVVFDKEKQKLEHKEYDKVNPNEYFVVLNKNALAIIINKKTNEYEIMNKYEIEYNSDNNKVSIKTNNMYCSARKNGDIIGTMKRKEWEEFTVW